MKLERLDLPRFPRALSSTGNSCNWLKAVLNPYRPMLFADTDEILPKKGECIQALERAAARGPGGNVVNDTEATLVNLIVQGLVTCGLHPSAIGVICPFNAQVSTPERGLHCDFLLQLISFPSDVDSIAGKLFSASSAEERRA